MESWLILYKKMGVLGDSLLFIGVDILRIQEATALYNLLKQGVLGHVAKL